MTPSWRDLAACIGEDPERFFPTAENGHPGRVQAAAAKIICGRCPVATECLEWALHALSHGIAGGLTAHERRERRATDARADRRRQKAGAS